MNKPGNIEVVPKEMNVKKTLTQSIFPPLWLSRLYLKLLLHSYLYFQICESNKTAKWDCQIVQKTPLV